MPKRKQSQGHIEHLMIELGIAKDALWISGVWVCHCPACNETGGGRSLLISLNGNFWCTKANVQGEDGDELITHIVEGAARDALRKIREGR